LGDDLHRLTAGLLLGKAAGEVTPEERQAAKAVNFGLIYGMRAAGLRAHARDHYGVELDDPGRYIERFFRGYPVLARQHHRLDHARPSETRTRSGRRRRWSATPGLTELLNTPVQGTGADLLKMALDLLPAALAGTNARPVGTVHNEVMVDAPVEEAPVVGEMLKEIMEQAGRGYLIQVPVVAEVSIAASWAKAQRRHTQGQATAESTTKHDRRLCRLGIARRLCSQGFIVHVMNPPHRWVAVVETREPNARHQWSSLYCVKQVLESAVVAALDSW